MMHRRHFLSTLAAGPAIGAAPMLAQSGSRSKQNVLFISIDDLNDWIGCLGGHPDAKTPNLDRLAARGVLFTNSHCNAPLCNPSRASIMTGLRPSTTGIYDNGQPMRKSPVIAKATTVTQHFRAHGYDVMGGGKIYHTAYPDAASWDSYFPSQTKNKPDDVRPQTVPANGIKGAANFDWGQVNVKDEEMGDAQVVAWASGELKKARTKPFFLACGIYRPHLPWYVPPRYFDAFVKGELKMPRVKDDDLDDVPPTGIKWAKPNGDHATVVKSGKYRDAVQAYLACIHFADAQVGKLLDALDASPHAKNTIVVLWSDHGWHLGEKLHWRKFSLWEEATHNVLMMSAPGVTKPGGRCTRPVSLIDVYPTLCDLAGVPLRDELEGVTLRPLLTNPKAAWERPVVTTYFKDNHAVRSERWRYIHYADGGEELYDELADPQEWTNLAKKPEYAAVKQELSRWLPNVNAPESVHERGANFEN